MHTSLIGQAVDGKILAELPKCKIVAAELSFPVAIRVRLIDHYGAMFAAVPGQVTLPIAIYIQPADHPPALHRQLPDAGVHGLPPPGDVPGQTDVD